MGNEELGREIKKVFEGTGLVTNVQVRGRLYDAENPLRLEYRIDDTSNSKEKILAKIRLFKRNLVVKLVKNYQIIKGVSEEYHDTGFCVERIVINPDAPKSDENKTREKILQTIEKELENYAMQTKHQK